MSDGALLVTDRIAFLCLTAWLPAVALSGPALARPLASPLLSVSSHPKQRAAGEIL
jgi:hypothetical protein